MTAHAAAPLFDAAKQGNTEAIAALLDAGADPNARDTGRLTPCTGRQRPPKPELVKRIATPFGGDLDLLFRLAESTDPDLADYIHLTPNVSEFLRTAKAMALTSEDFEVLIEEVRKRRPSEAATTRESLSGGRSR